MSSLSKLAWHTPPRWVAHVEREPLALLSDHAHCELKAAASAQALIARNPGERELAGALAEVAGEELEHFRRVLEVLHARGGELGSRTAGPYAEGLHRAAARGRRSVLLDRLLVAHLIEARSLERFTLLAEHLRDAELAALYRGLLASEAAHQALFLRLARRHFAPGAVAGRLAELRAAEGALVRALPCEPRVHSGPPEGEERP